MAWCRIGDKPLPEPMLAEFQNKANYLVQVTLLPWDDYTSYVTYLLYSGLYLIVAG